MADNEKRQEGNRRKSKELTKIMAGRSRYTHLDSEGMPWRFEHGRAISMLADEVSASCLPELTKKKVTPLEIDLSFLKNRVKMNYEAHQLTVPQFAVYNFINAHKLESFTVSFLTYKIANRGCIVDRCFFVTLGQRKKTQKFLLVKSKKKYDDAISYHPNETSSGVYYCFLDYDSAREVMVDEETVRINQRQHIYIPTTRVNPLVDSYFQEGLDVDFQFPRLDDSFSHYRKTTIRFSVDYNGVLPVPVQQLVHRAKQEYEQVVLIAEADWKRAVVEEIRPQDPLIVAFKENKAYLLCKFAETIEENYYAVEFTMEKHDEKLLDPRQWE